MSDLQAIADRVEIEALRGEFSDAVMMNDHDRLASLFTPGGAVRIPEGDIEAAGREEIRALGERRQALTDWFVQTTHPGTIELDGDTATGRAYLSELARGRDGGSQLNYFVYHDRYQRTGDGWKFTERVAEFRYLDASPLAGSPPQAAGAGKEETGQQHRSGEPGDTRWPGHLPVGALRVVRWSAHYDQTVAFYRDIVGLAALETFHGSYGLDGTILGLPDGSVHLEIVRLPDARNPAPGLDQLVFYLPDAAAQERITARLAAAGLGPVRQIDYWEDNGGVTYQDPDGREVVFASWIYRPPPDSR